MLMLADTTVSLKSAMDVLTPIAAVVVTIFLALIGLIAYFLKRLINQLDVVAQEVKPIRPAIVELQNLLTPAKLKKLMFPLTVAPGSPLKVTEYGHKLLSESGFDTILTDNAKTLIEAVKRKNPKTNYDIQTYANVVVKEFVQKDEAVKTRLKNYAFNNGIDLEMLMPPAGVTLRDKVMETLSFSDND